MSGGERRRVEIARCIAVNPSFILLDEPFAGVDPIAIQELKQMIFQLKEKNIGVLITDHNVRETLSITDRSYLLYDGKILKAGTIFQKREFRHWRIVSSTPPQTALIKYK